VKNHTQQKKFTANGLLHQNILGSEEKLGLVKKNWPGKKIGLVNTNPKNLPKNFRFTKN
jgi:hypothetical protein